MKIEKLFDAAPILNDPIYRSCLILASESRSPEIYGSRVMKDNLFIGTGRNRAVVHRYFKLDREIVQGYSNHAEVEAVLDARREGWDVRGSDVYSAGYFRNEKQLFLHNLYTCSVCIPYLERLGIKNIYIPTPERWVKRPIEEAKEEAKWFKGDSHRRRLQVSMKGFKVDDFKGLVNVLNEISL